MRIMGIDPANNKVSWVVWDTKGGIIAKAQSEKGLLAHTHCEEIERFIKHMPAYVRDFCINYIAIENVQSFGMAVGKTTFDTVRNIGRIQQYAMLLDLTPILINRGEIKINFCHSMKAKDTNIKQALIDRFGEVGTKKNPGFFYGISKDNWQAFAVAATAFDRKYKEIS